MQYNLGRAAQPGGAQAGNAAWRTALFAASPQPPSSTAAASAPGSATAARNPNKSDEPASKGGKATSDTGSDKTDAAAATNKTASKGKSGDAKKALPPARVASAPASEVPASELAKKPTGTAAAKTKAPVEHHHDPVLLFGFINHSIAIAMVSFGIALLDFISFVAILANTNTPLRNAEPVLGAAAAFAFMACLALGWMGFSPFLRQYPGDMEDPQVGLLTLGSAVAIVVLEFVIFILNALVASLCSDIIDSYDFKETDEEKSSAAAAPLAKLPEPETEGPVVAYDGFVAILLVMILNLIFKVCLVPVLVYVAYHYWEVLTNRIIVKDEEHEKKLKKKAEEAKAGQAKTVSAPKAASAT